MIIELMYVSCQPGLPGVYVACNVRLVKQLLEGGRGCLELLIQETGFCILNCYC